MQLTAYRAVCTSCEVTHLNQRQHLLKALQRLAKETHGGIALARAELDKAPEEQRKILAPKKSPADQGTPHLHIVGDSQEPGRREQQ
jgi:hypothetical protein